MTKQWAPSMLGRKMTGSVDWQLELSGLQLSLALNGQTHRVNVEEETAYRINQGLLWTDVTFYPGHRLEIKADGLPNAQAASLSEALETALFDKRTREDVAHIQGAQQAISQWLDSKAAQELSAKSNRRWFTSEMQTALIQARPTIDAADVRARMEKPAVKAFLAEAAGGIERSLDQWAADHRTFWASLNAAHTERELVDCKNLFDKVESKPLTEEQSRAVICFDNRVQVVASAGSGKTSTMVAKAAYAIDRGIVAPE